MKLSILMILTAKMLKCFLILHFSIIGWSPLRTVTLDRTRQTSYLVQCINATHQADLYISSFKDNLLITRKTTKHFNDAQKFSQVMSKDFNPHSIKISKLRLLQIPAISLSG